MRTFSPVLALCTAFFLYGCADHSTSVESLALSATDAVFSRHGPPDDLVEYRVTGDYVLTQHSWWIFKRLEARNLNAWVTRDGTVGGSMDFYLEFADELGIPPVLSHEEIVCVSVNPKTREAWLVAVRYANGQPHYSIAQARDLAPAAMSETGHLQSGHRDIANGRSMTPEEGPDFCMQQPDLASIPVGSMPPVEMFPIESGDVSIQIGGER